MGAPRGVAGDLDAAGALLSSLGNTPHNNRCARGQPFQWLSVSTGQLFPDECQTWSCPACGPRRARRYARAIEHAGYERFVTLSRTPANPRAACARLAYLVRRAGYAWETAWIVETGEQTGMRHVHALQRGSYVPWAFLKASCRDAGFLGSPDIRAAKDGQAHYAGKAWYSAKQSAGDYREWLALNGGRRIWHWSRGYTGGVPLRQWVSEHTRGKDEGPFVPYGAGMWDSGRRRVKVSGDAALRRIANTFGGVSVQG